MLKAKHDVYLIKFQTKLTVREKEHLLQQQEWHFMLPMFPSKSHIKSTKSWPRYSRHITYNSVKPHGYNGKLQL